MTLFNPKLRVFHQGLILVGLPLILELLLIGNLWNLLLHADRELARESRYRQFSALGSRLMTLTYEAPYLLITSLQGGGNRYFLAYERDVEQVKQLKSQALALAKDDPLIEDVSVELEESLSVILGICDTLAEAKRSGSSLNLIHELPRIQQRFNNSKNLAIERIAIIVKIGQHTTAESEKRIRRMRSLMSWILLFGVFSNILLGVALLVFFRKRILERIKVITENTLLLSQKKELHKPLGGGDEIDQLDRAFHLMNTELIEASRRETSLFNNASDVICVLDSNAQFLKINSACERLWFYKSEQLLSHSLLNLLDESDKASFEKLFAKCKASPEPVNLEIKIKRNDESVIETLWSTFWSVPEQCLYCVVHDISERKQVERIKQKFIALISKELKKPLSSISDSLSGLLIPTAKLSDLARSKLINTQSNLKRLLQLVSELLQIAEMESAAKMQLEFADFDIFEIVSQAVSDVEGLAQARNIQLIVEVKSSNCNCDKNRMVQVLVNLLSNAIKFSPESSTVTVNALSDGIALKICVIDSGRGVPESHRQTIFEKFKQVEASDGRPKTGTGLGLPICKDIVEAHSGSIGVKSNEGQGSVFWITLPLTELERERLRAQKENLISAADESMPLAGQSTAQTDLGKITKPSEKKRFQLKLIHKGVLLVGIPILFESAFVGALAVQLTQSEQMRQSELKQRKIAAYSNRMLQGFMKAALLITLTKSRDNWVAFEAVYKEILHYRQTIKKLLANDPAVAQDFENLEISNKKWDEFYVAAAERMKEGFTEVNSSDTMDKRAILLPITANIARKVLRLVEDVEKREFEPAKQAAQRKKLGLILLAGLCSNVIVSVLLALYFSKDITSRLAQLADNAERLANDKPLNTPLSGTDEIANLDRVFHETSEAVQAARKKERAVFDNAQDLICSVDENARFLSLNQASARLLGSDAASLKDKVLYEFVSPNEKEKMQAALSITDAGAQNHCVVESSLTRSDGALIYLQWSISKAPQENQVYCVAHDITIRKEFEQLKQEFLAMVSHDLRSPLTSISAMSKLVSTGMFGGIGDREDELLEAIEIESSRLIELINDLLDIEKYEAGKMELLLEEVDLNAFLRENCISLLGRSRLSFDFADEHHFVEIDKARFSQAISNLLKFFMQIDPQARVTVSSRVQQNALVLLLSSSGTQLSEQACSAAFDRFRDESIEFSIGSGLALPISERIIQSHRGRIKLSSDADAHMNVFEITLNSNFSSEE